MAVSKNFVVKNGLEVNTDLIFTDVEKQLVGIGTTVVGHTLHVIGGIGATNLYVSGITTLAATGGITTTGGDLYVGGDLFVKDDLVLDEITARDVTISGIATINRLDVVDHITNNLDVQGGVNITGVLTASGFEGSSIGFGTPAGAIGYAATFLDFQGPGVSTGFFDAGSGIGTIFFSGGGGGGNISVSSLAPAGPDGGDLWFNIEEGRTFIFYDEPALGLGNARVWIDASPFNVSAGLGTFLSRSGDNMEGQLGILPGSQNVPGLYFKGNTGKGFYYSSGKVSVSEDFHVDGKADASDGFNIGISSAGTLINGNSGITTLNFVGVGNTFGVNGTTVDISIAGGGAGIGTAIDMTAVPGTTGQDVIYYVNEILEITTNSTITAPNSTDVAYTNYEEVVVNDGIDLIIDDGDQFVVDVLGLSTYTTNVQGAAPAANAVTGPSMNIAGIATMQHVTVTKTTANTAGVVTATQGSLPVNYYGNFYGDGKNIQNLVSGVGIITAGGTVGTGATFLDLRGAGVSTCTVSAGIATINIEGGGGGGSLDQTFFMMGQVTAMRTQ